MIIFAIALKQNHYFYMRKIITLFIIFQVVNVNAQNFIECDKIIDILSSNRILALKKQTIGVIDTLGNTIIDFKYNNSQIFMDDRFGYSNKLLLTSNIETDELVLLNIETGENIIKDIEKVKRVYIMEDYAIICSGGNLTYTYDKKFYINSYGQKLFDIPSNSGKFFNASYIRENKVLLTQNSRGIYVDTLGNKLSSESFLYPSDFSNNMAINGTIKNGVPYYGFINTAWEQVIEHIYSKRPTAFSDGMARVENTKGLFGYIDIKGDILIKPQYLNASGFYKGCALVKNSESKWLIIDKNNNVLNEINRRISDFYRISSHDEKQISVIKQIIDEGLFRIKFISYGYETINKDGEVIFNNEEDVRSFKYGKAVFYKRDNINKENIYGIIDKNKKIILQTKRSEF